MKAIFRKRVGFSIGLLLIFTTNLNMLTLSLIDGRDTSNEPFRINERTYGQNFVDYGGTQIWGGIFSKGSIVHFNCTVLPKSNASVEFWYLYACLNYSTWLPEPPNFVLAIGESFAANYTLNRTINQASLPFTYDICTTERDENATVLWWYEILVTGKTALIGCHNLSGIFTITEFGIIILLGNKRRRK